MFGMRRRSSSPFSAALLTTRRQFDILQAGPSWQATKAIRSIETTRVCHASRHERPYPGRMR